MTAKRLHTHQSHRQMASMKGVRNVTVCLRLTYVRYGLSKQLFPGKISETIIKTTGRSAIMQATDSFNFIQFDYHFH